MNSNHEETKNEEEAEKVYCKDCSVALEKLEKETLYYEYFKCPNCQKVFKQKKSLSTDQSIYIIGRQLQELRYTVLCILFIIALQFIIWIILIFS
ncbi:MAG: hypothetical protein ACFE8M_04955 [Candidatus Hermodarchaeota archaeon]